MVQSDLLNKYFLAIGVEPQFSRVVKNPTIVLKLLITDQTTTSTTSMEAHHVSPKSKANTKRKVKECLLLCVRQVVETLSD